MKCLNTFTSASRSFQTLFVIGVLTVVLCIVWSRNVEHQLNTVYAHMPSPPLLAAAQTDTSKISYYLQQQRTAPNDREIAFHLAELYSNQVVDGTGSLWVHLTKNDAPIRSAASSEVKQMKILIASSRSIDNQLDFSDSLAEAQVTAGQLANAYVTAHYLLSTARQSTSRRVRSNAIYAGNEVLGRLAVRAHHWHAAARYLIRSANVTGEPNSIIVGPDMRLARALILHGDHSVVVRFLTRCKSFWKIDGAADALDSWIHLVSAGQMPPFGGGPLSFELNGVAY